VFVTDSNSEYTTGLVVDVAVDQPEATGRAAGDVKLNAGVAGQVAGDIPGSKELAGYPSICEIIEHFASGDYRLWLASIARSSAIAGWARTR
jgi:hypothetical protein